MIDGHPVQLAGWMLSIGDYRCMWVEKSHWIDGKRCLFSVSCFHQQNVYDGSDSLMTRDPTSSRGDVEVGTYFVPSQRRRL